MNSHKCDVLLIHPSARKNVYQSLGKNLAAIEPPLWAALMAAYCRNHGLTVNIIDAEAEELSHDQVADIVGQEKPVLAVVVVYGHQPSASTQTMTAAGQVCTAIKECTPNQQILLVGGHVASLPRRTLTEEAADYVAAGEGLRTMVDLTNALKTSSSLTNVPGLWYRQGNEIVNTPDSELTSRPDKVMPMPAWDLLPMSKYRAHNWHCSDNRDRQPYASIYTTLGCPYHCSFCCIQAPFRTGERAAGMSPSRNSYRYWNPHTILAQIDELVHRYGVRNIKIADEMFVLNRRHLTAICKGLIERNYDLNIWAYARVDTIHDDMLTMLKDAGFTWLALGIEAGAESVRAEVDKRYSQQQVFEVVQRIRNAGIHVIGNYIFGLPDDDENTMQATLDLALELRCEFANFYSAMAYPGSSLYGEALQHGIPLPKHWTGYSQHSRDCLPLPTRHLTARDVLQFRDRAFLHYFRDAEYLKMMESRFGMATAQHLRDVTKLSLERDLLSGQLQVPSVTWPTTESFVDGQTSLPVLS